MPYSVETIRNEDTQTERTEITIFVNGYTLHGTTYTYPIWDIEQRYMAIRNLLTYLEVKIDRGEFELPENHIILQDDDPLMFLLSE